MTLRRYGRYKDSGVEWLGAVPAHWTVTRLKFIAHVQTGVAKGKDNTGQQTIVVPYLRVANVQDGYLDLEDVATIEIPADDLPRYRLRAGDVLMNEGGDFDKLGRGHVWDGSIDPCIHQNHVFAVRPFGVSPQWLNLVTGSAYAQFYFMSRSKQSTNLASISSTNVMELPVVLPPGKEQTAITGFLAREVAKIDTLIAEQQRLIELLTEKRQAVIAQAVTKGLDPDVPMTDSGVEWLGEVPAHWRVARLGYFASVENGMTPSRDVPEYWVDGEVPWLSSGEVNKLYIESSEECITQHALERCSLRVLPVGTVVVGLIGQGKTRGMSALLRMEAAINQNLAAVCPGSLATGSYLLYVFHAMYDWLREAGRGGNQAAMNCEMLRALRLPFPTVSEQKAIAMYVDSRLAELDALKSTAEEGMAVLSERRTSLISAAVTGQIDVRDSASVESTLAETRADIAAGRYVVESAAAHVVRVQAMAAADEHSPSPPHSC